MVGYSCKRSSGFTLQGLGSERSFKKRPPKRCALRSLALVAEWIHFTLFGIILPQKTESVHFWVNSATKSLRLLMHLQRSRPRTVPGGTYLTLVRDTKFHAQGATVYHLCLGAISRRPRQDIAYRMVSCYDDYSDKARTT